MANERSTIDQNYKAGGVIAGVSNDASLEIIQLRVDPVTKRLLVDVSISGLPTDLTDNEAVNAANTGTMVLGTDGSNYQVLHTDSSGDLQVDVLTMPTVAVTNAGLTELAAAINTSSQMDVNIAASNATVTVSATNLDIRDLTQASDSVLTYGSDDGGTTKRVIKTDSGGAVAVDIESSATLTVNAHAVTNAGTFVVQENGNALTALQLIDDVVYTDGAGTPSKGIAIMGTDGTNPKLITVDSSGNLQVDILNASIAVTGTFWQATQPVSLASVPSHAVTNAGTFAVQTTSSISGIGHGVKTITAAGSDEALAGSISCKRVTIQAQTDNTGFIAVGATGVDATVATGTGILLSAGDVFEMDIDNLADIFIDATVTGDGVRYTYFT